MPALTIPHPVPPVDLSPPHPTRDPHPRPPPGPLYSHAHFDNRTVHPYYDRVYSPPSSAIFSHLAHVPPPWQTHIPHSPYPPPRPPQLVHKVWILDCRACRTFLTNRGMKAVLLLRPNVSLFSTDALPVNCSAYSTNPDALRPPLCRPSTSPSPPRTCECLTQTLCCHTCGTTVGYMIVIPCSRCTSSISATNRATNGHRFVFHSSEIIASERHHIFDEPGVLPVEHPTPPPSSPPPLPAVFHSAADVAVHRRPGVSLPSQAFQPLQTSSPSPGSDYPPSPQMESPEFVLSSVHSSPDPFASASPRPLLQSPFLRNPVPQTLPETRRSTPEPSPRRLKAGDVLYWHHLTKHGEIPGVAEDPRARMPSRGNPLKFLDR